MNVKTTGLLLLAVGVGSVIISYKKTNERINEEYEEYETVRQKINKAREFIQQKYNSVKNNKRHEP